MTRGIGRKNATLSMAEIQEFGVHFRRIIYLEIYEPRYAELQDSYIHFFALFDDELREYEIDYKDDPMGFELFREKINMGVNADLFRKYKFRLNFDGDYWISVRKGVILEANSDLSSFIFRNGGNSHIISPYNRDVFVRLREERRSVMDGVSQLVRVKCLLKNEKFNEIYREYFGVVGLDYLQNSSTAKNRYVDNILHINPITSDALHDEYLDKVNEIPMSDFTAQSVLSQVMNEGVDIKQVLFENYSFFLFMDERELNFATILLAAFFHSLREKINCFDWLRTLDFIRYRNDEIFLSAKFDVETSEQLFDLYRALFVIDNVPMPKLVHFLYDFFEFKNLSRNIGTFYLGINELIGEDIRDKFLKVETVNVSRKSYEEAKQPVDFFRYPQIVNFSLSADKKIQEEILSGDYDHAFATYYFCNYRQVSDYKKYADVLPAVMSVVAKLKIENRIDVDLFSAATQLLNEVWEIVRHTKPELENEFEKSIYELYWSRIGDAWPIAHRDEIRYKDDYYYTIFDQSVAEICQIRNLSILDRKLQKYLKDAAKRIDLLDIGGDVVARKIAELKIAKMPESGRLLNYLELNNDNLAWIDAAMYCPDITEKAKIEDIFSKKNGVVAEKEYALERLLLNSANVIEVMHILTGQLDDLRDFHERHNHPDGVLDDVAALSENILDAAALAEFRKFTRKVQALLGKNSEERIQHFVARAEANVRKVKLQNKDLINLGN